MGIELHFLALWPIRELGVCMLRCPEIVYFLVQVVIWKLDWVWIEVSIVVHEILADDIREVSNHRDSSPSSWKAETAVDRCMKFESGVLGKVCLSILLGCLVLCGNILILSWNIPHLTSVSRIHTCPDRRIVWNRLSYYISKTGFCDFPTVEAIEKFGNLLAVVVECGVESEEIIPSPEDIHTESDIKTIVCKAADIGCKWWKSWSIWIRNIHQHWSSCSVVVFDIEIENVEHSTCQGNCKEALLLPCKFRVARLADNHRW